MNATPTLEHEITSGFLDNATEDSRGVFLLYRRDDQTHECSGFRLIRAPSLFAVLQHIGTRPRGGKTTVRLVTLRYPGQLAATEQYFGCTLEVVR